MNLKDTLFLIADVYDWATFQHEFCASANNPTEADEFLKGLKNTAIVSGLKPDQLQYVLEVKLKEGTDGVYRHTGENTDPYQIGALVLKFKPLTARFAASGQFMFPLLSADEHGNIEFDPKNYQHDNQVGDEVEAGSEPLRSDSIEHHEPKEAQAREAHPITGWFKKVLDRQMFSYSRLLEVLAQALPEADHFARFATLLDNALVGELPILDRENHLAFKVVPVAEGEEPYARLLISMRSRRLDVLVQSNLLAIGGNLIWDETGERLYPTLDIDSLTWTKPEYAGSLIDHALGIKRFDFQRIATHTVNSQSTEERLGLYLDGDLELARRIIERLKEEGVYDLIDRVVFRVEQVFKTADETDALQQIVMKFYHHSAIEVAEVTSVWAYDPIRIAFVPLTQSELNVKVFTHEVAEALRKAAEVKVQQQQEQSARLASFDLKDTLTPLHDEPTKAPVMRRDMKTHLSNIKRARDHKAKVAISIECASTNAAKPILSSLEVYVPQLLVRYEALVDMITRTQEVNEHEKAIVFELNGEIVPGYSAESHLTMSLSYTETVVDGVEFKAQASVQID